MHALQVRTLLLYAHFTMRTLVHMCSCRKARQHAKINGFQRNGRIAMSPKRARSITATRNKQQQRTDHAGGTGGLSELDRQLLKLVPPGNADLAQPEYVAHMEAKRKRLGGPGLARTLRMPLQKAQLPDDYAECFVHLKSSVILTGSAGQHQQQRGDGAAEGTGDDCGCVFCRQYIEPVPRPARRSKLLPPLTSAGAMAGGAVNAGMMAGGEGGGGVDADMMDETYGAMQDAGELGHMWDPSGQLRMPGQDSYMQHGHPADAAAAATYADIAAMAGQPQGHLQEQGQQQQQQMPATSNAASWGTHTGTGTEGGADDALGAEVDAAWGDDAEGEEEEQQQAAEAGGGGYPGDGNNALDNAGGAGDVEEF